MPTIGKVSFCDKCRKIAKPAINLEEGVFCGQCVNRVIKKRKNLPVTVASSTEVVTSTEVIDTSTEYRIRELDANGNDINNGSEVI